MDDFYFLLDCLLSLFYFLQQMCLISAIRKEGVKKERSVLFVLRHFNNVPQYQAHDTHQFPTGRVPF